MHLCFKLKYNVFMYVQHMYIVGFPTLTYFFQLTNKLLVSHLSDKELCALNSYYTIQVDYMFFIDFQKLSFLFICTIPVRKLKPRHLNTVPRLPCH